jgi:hypothetical protein
MVVIDSPAKIEKASGRLGVPMPGLGAVSTTFIAGTLAIRKGLSRPIGSLTQMGSLRLGKRTEKREVDIKDFVPLANLDDLFLEAGIYSRTIAIKRPSRPVSSM